MAVITTRTTVAPDGTVSTAFPLPAGSYTASVAVISWRAAPIKQEAGTDELHAPA